MSESGQHAKVERLLLKGVKDPALAALLLRRVGRTTAPISMKARLPREAGFRAAQEGGAAHAAAIARTSDSPELLATLAKSRSLAVRAAVAANPNTPVPIRGRLLRRALREEHADLVHEHAPLPLGALIETLAAADWDNVPGSMLHPAQHTLVKHGPDGIRAALACPHPQVRTLAARALPDGPQEITFAEVGDADPGLLRQVLAAYLNRHGSRPITGDDARTLLRHRPWSDLPPAMLAHRARLPLTREAIRLLWDSREPEARRWAVYAKDGHELAPEIIATGDVDLLAALALEHNKALAAQHLNNLIMAVARIGPDAVTTEAYTRSMREVLRDLTWRMTGSREFPPITAEAFRALLPHMHHNELVQWLCGRFAPHVPTARDMAELTHRLTPREVNYLRGPLLDHAWCWADKPWAQTLLDLLGIAALRGSHLENPSESLSTLIAAWLRTRLGEDPQTWSRFLDLLPGFHGGLDELIAAARDHASAG
ncbi:hypothetical protein [Bailinhaonella thermotolerans]|uniref:Uncharacterized protein n=1 Tax=Bailinhaonella thermotolerans TaxID=1070861 RepID=A0A3A3ZZL6_9ACTN|nr:hypothetical protein [Bailinhaonella thermotolerans]RJL21233.1 hypothetical protein D5H75_37845 [Bailinhaonella thermotolerans]